jgi:hypothetical protein
LSHYQKHKKFKPKERKVRKNVVSFPPLLPLGLLPGGGTQIILDYYFPVNWILVSATDDVVNNTEQMHWFLIPEDEPLLQNLKDKEDQVTHEMLR